MEDLQKGIRAPPSKATFLKLFKFYPFGSFDRKIFHIVSNEVRFSIILDFFINEDDTPLIGKHDPREFMIKYFFQFQNKCLPISIVR